MNKKSALIAALIAASTIATGTAFAAEFKAAAGNPSLKIGQTVPMTAPSSDQVRTVAVAARADGKVDLSKDTTRFATAAKTDTVPSAEARAKFRAYEKNWIANRMTRDVTEGSAQ